MQCKRRHHSSLHGDQELEKNATPGEAVTISSNQCSFKPVSGQAILLATALVQIKHHGGYENETVNALLDQGSQASFVTERTKAKTQQDAN